MSWSYARRVIYLKMTYCDHMWENTCPVHLKTWLYWKLEMQGNADLHYWRRIPIWCKGFLLFSASHHAWPLTMINNLLPFSCILILLIWYVIWFAFAIPHPQWCFCPYTFFQNTELNTLPSDYFMPNIHSTLGYSTREFWGYKSFYPRQILFQLVFEKL